MRPTSTRVGTSGGNLNVQSQGLSLRDVSNTTRCLLFGKGITRETYVYVRQDNLQYRRHEYAKLSQVLVIPSDALAAEIKRIGHRFTGNPLLESTEPLPESIAPCYVPNSHARPIICLRTGRFYQSADEAGRKNKITNQAVSYQLNKTAKSPKPPTFRHATEDEIKCAMTIPGWKAQV